MQSNRVVTLALVVLMVTAGCVGGGGGGAAATDASTGASGGSGDGGGGASANDADGPDLTDTEAALRDAGSFTVSWRSEGVDATGVRTEVTREFYADLNAERSLTVTASGRDGQSDAGSSEQFVTEGVTYVRAGSETSPTYASYPQSGDVVATAIALSQARAYGADDDMVSRGTETFDGVTVTRYELSEADSQLIQAGSRAGSGSSGVAEITDFEYVVLVDEAGLSRYESWSFTGRTEEGQTVSGEWEYSLTALGSTTVDDPDWLAEARTQTQS